jgi:hypothetical protein
LSRFENDFEQILQINGGLSSARLSSSSSFSSSSFTTDGSGGGGCGLDVGAGGEIFFLFLTSLLNCTFLLAFRICPLLLFISSLREASFANGDCNAARPFPKASTLHSITIFSDCDVLSCSPGGRISLNLEQVPEFSILSRLSSSWLSPFITVSQLSSSGLSAFTPEFC